MEGAVSYTHLQGLLRLCRDARAIRHLAISASATTIWLSLTAVYWVQGHSFILLASAWAMTASRFTRQLQDAQSRPAPLLPVHPRGRGLVEAGLFLGLTFALTVPLWLSFPPFIEDVAPEGTGFDALIRAMPVALLAVPWALLGVWTPTLQGTRRLLPVLPPTLILLSAILLGLADSSAGVLLTAAVMTIQIIACRGVDWDGLAARVELPGLRSSSVRSRTGLYPDQRLGEDLLRGAIMAGTTVFAAVLAIAAIALWAPLPARANVPTPWLGLLAIIALLTPLFAQGAILGFPLWTTPMHAPGWGPWQLLPVTAGRLERALLMHQLCIGGATSLILLALGWWITRPVPQPALLEELAVGGVRFGLPILPAFALLLLKTRHRWTASSRTGLLVAVGACAGLTTSLLPQDLPSEVLLELLGAPVLEELEGTALALASFGPAAMFACALWGLLLWQVLRNPRARWEATT